MRPTLTLEVAILDVPERNQEFEHAFDEAQVILTRMKGYIDHGLHRCIEKPGRYLLLVRWETLEDHTEGFRRSSEYQRWKSLLQQYYDPFPEVEHYRSIAGS